MIQRALNAHYRRVMKDIIEAVSGHHRTDIAILIAIALDELPVLILIACRKPLKRAGRKVIYYHHKVVGVFNQLVYHSAAYEACPTGHHDPSSVANYIFHT